jgi:hypothetical protein
MGFSDSSTGGLPETKCVKSVEVVVSGSSRTAVDRYAEMVSRGNTGTAPTKFADVAASC